MFKIFKEAQGKKVIMYIKIPILARTKVIMQGKLIAVVYTLRTYWNQFSLGSVRLVSEEDKSI